MKIKKSHCHTCHILSTTQRVSLHFCVCFDQDFRVLVPMGHTREGNGRQFLTCDSKRSISGSGHSIGGIKVELMLSVSWGLRLLRLEVEVGGHTPIIPIINPS